MRKPLAHEHELEEILARQSAKCMRAFPCRPWRCGDFCQLFQGRSAFIDDARGERKMQRQNSWQRFPSNARHF